MEILTKTVEVLEEKEWCRLSLALDKDYRPASLGKPEVCAVCWMGAMITAYMLLHPEYIDPFVIEEHLPLKAALQDVYDELGMSVVAYNDSVAKSKQHVLNATRRTIVALKYSQK